MLFRSEVGVESNDKANRARAYPPFVQLPSERQRQVKETCNKTFAALQPVRDDKSPEAIKVPDESKGLDWIGLNVTGASCAMRKIEPITQTGLGGVAASNFDIPENSNRILKEGPLAHLNFPVAPGETVILEFPLPETALNTVRVDSVNPFDFLWNRLPDDTDHVYGMDLATIRQALPDIELEIEEGGKRRPLPEIGRAHV